MSGGESLVRALAAHGVDTVFGIPGTHNLSIYAHLRHHGIRHVSPRHEQGAGFAADGYARVTRRPGVCLTTSGPAVLNAATAAAQSYSDSVPVLLVSPGMPLDHPGRGNGYLHEVKDQSRALDAIVAYSHRVTSVEEIPLAVTQAFGAMTSGRPRPVHLEVPLDLLEEVAEAVIPPPLRIEPPAPPAAALDAAVAALRSGSRPGIVAGGGCRLAAEEVRRTAERFGAPVLVTANGKGVISDDHPLALGAGAHHRAAVDFAADCDVVLAIGTELAPADLWTGPMRSGGDLVRVDIDPIQVVTNAEPTVPVVGDAGAALRGILARAEDWPTPVEPEQRARVWRSRLRDEARREGRPWLGLVDVVADAVGRDGVVVGDSAMVCYYGMISNLPAYAPSTFLYPTGLGTLGYGLPAAIGAKLGRPDARVMAVLGDGGAMFSIAELAAGAQLGLALPVVIVDNGGYGEIRREMQARSDDVQAVNLDSVDFVAVARAMGCRAARSDDPTSFAEALHEGLAGDRPLLVHVREETVASWAEGSGP